MSDEGLGIFDAEINEIIETSSNSDIKLILLVLFGRIKLLCF